MTLVGFARAVVTLSSLLGQPKQDRNNWWGSEQCSRAIDTNGGMICSATLPFKANGTKGDVMTLFIAIVTMFCGTIQSNAIKSFTVVTLDSTYVSKLIPSLCCISYNNRRINGSPIFYSSLSDDTLPSRRSSLKQASKNGTRWLFIRLEHATSKLKRSFIKNWSLLFSCIIWIANKAIARTLA